MTEPTEREAIMSAAKHTLGPWHAKAGMTQMCDPESTTIARCGVAGNEGAFWWIFSSAEAGDGIRLAASQPVGWRRSPLLNGQRLWPCMPVSSNPGRYDN